MNKKEFIKKYGEDAYNKKLGRARAWKVQNPKRTIEHCRRQTRKGGAGYPKQLRYNHTGLQGERGCIRMKHGHKWRPYKRIIAPDSQIHHQWKRGLAEYDGVALVEKDQHMHGFIDVIEILDGKITVFTEKELREMEI